MKGPHSHGELQGAGVTRWRSWEALGKAIERGRCDGKFQEAWEASKNRFVSSQTRNSPSPLFQLCFKSIAQVT